MSILAPYMIAAGAFVAGIIGAWLAGHRSASKAQQMDDLQSGVKSHEIRNEVENRIARDGGNPADKLRSDWHR